MEKDNNPTKNSEVNNSFNTLGVQNFRTLQNDMIDSVKRQDSSIAQRIIADRKRKRESGHRDQRIHIEDSRSKNGLNIFLGVGTVVVIIIIAIIIKLVLNNSAGDMLNKQNINAIIPVDKQVVLNIDPLTEKDLDVLTENALTNNKTCSGEILHLYFTKKETVTDKETNTVKKITSVLPVDEFFDLWQNDTHDILIRSFKKEDYMFGFYNDGTEMLPFLLFKSKDSDQTFAGMLKWESSLCKNVQSIFQTEKVCLKDNFKDDQILDIDTRVLESKPKTPIILYGYLNNENILIITQDAVVFEEIKHLFD